MDPQVCFEQFVTACKDGDYEVAGERQAAYEGWIERDGLPATLEPEVNVLKLDLEQDRYYYNVVRQIDAVLIGCAQPGRRLAPRP